MTEEKRYTLIAALSYPRPSVEKNRISAVRCKLENAFTGPESRRSGAIQSSDAAFNAVRRRELRAGSYTLVLTRPPLAALAPAISLSGSFPPRTAPAASAPTGRVTRFAARPAGSERLFDLARFLMSRSSSPTLFPTALFPKPSAQASQIG